MTVTAPPARGCNHLVGSIFMSGYPTPVGSGLRYVNGSYKPVRAPQAIEPVSADIRMKSAAREAGIVTGMVDAPESPEKATAMEKSAPYIGELESPNRDKLIHGMIAALDAMTADSRFSDAAVNKVAGAVMRSQSFMNEGHHTALTDLMVRNPKAGQFLAANLPSRDEAIDRSEPRPPSALAEMITASKPAELRFLSAREEASLAANIATHPDPYVKAAQLELYSGQINLFEPENRATIIRGAFELLKDGRAPSSARSKASDVLVKLQPHMNSGENIELSNLLIEQFRPGASVQVNPEVRRTASWPTLTNQHTRPDGRNASLKERSRTHSFDR